MLYVGQCVCEKDWVEGVLQVDKTDSFRGSEDARHHHTERTVLRLVPVRIGRQTCGTPGKWRRH